MHLTPIRIEPVLPHTNSIEHILDRHLTDVPEHSILAISAKIIALCEGSVVSKDRNKETLIQEEADYFLKKRYRKFGASGTIVHHAFIAVLLVSTNPTHPTPLSSSRATPSNPLHGSLPISRNDSIETTLASS